MQPGKAIAAGIVGAGLMTIAMAIARAAGMPINFEMLSGSMLLGFIGPAVWVIGLVVHLVAGAVWGLVYALLFERATRRANAFVGASFGLAHAVLSGLLLGIVPYVHPLSPKLLVPPGLFMSSAGIPGVILFLALHVMFGAIVGAYYSPILLKNQRLAPTP
jgi:hypothetical protein